MLKIDIHCHTTPRPLPNTANPDASLTAIAAHMQAHAIVKTVLLATYFPDNGTGITNYRLLHWVQHKPEFAMFGSLDFEHFFYQGYNELEELASAGHLAGIKIYTAYQNIDFGSERFQQVAALARTHRLPLMFHGGVSYRLWRKLGAEAILALTGSLNATLSGQDQYKTPQDFAGIAQAFPEVNLIVSHLCKPFFAEMAEALKQHPNLYTDMSGILDSKRDAHYRAACVEQVRRMVGECGPGKLLFGTDFPVQTHADSVYFIEEAMQGYAPEEKQQVYFANAQRIVFGQRS